MWVEACNSEWLAFEDIPEEERLHSNYKLCGLLKLSSLCERSIGFSPLRPELIKLAYLDDCHELNRADILYLIRCGIGWDKDVACFYMIVN